MLPENSLSLTSVIGKYNYPDNLETSNTLDFELGGVDLQDPSQGLRVKSWAVYIEGQDIWIAAEDREPVILFSRVGILTEVSLAFDQNMRPVVAFVENGVSTLYWYDTFISNFTFTTLPDTLTPRVCLDDKRETQTGSSDVLLAYIKDNSLYFRMQRDRFQIEYLLRADVNATLKKMGMTNKSRVQFLMIPVT